MAKLTVDVSNLDLFKQLVQIIRDTTNDDRVPAAVRKEIMTKVQAIVESKDDA
jgi:uncharacterized protein (UPF0147 family)